MKKLYQPLFDAEFVVLHTKIICLFILFSSLAFWKSCESLKFINFLFLLWFYRILVGAPLGRNPQPNTNRSGTLKRCPVSQNQYDCQDVLTDGRLSECAKIFFAEKNSKEIKGF